MPKTIMDYTKTIMYKIVCNDLNIKDVYVGHTTNFTKRKYKHKRTCHRENGKGFNYKIYQTIRDNGGWENWSMVMIEEHSCSGFEQARKRERQLYDELNANMNMLKPYVTAEERIECDKLSRKIYDFKNKSVIAEQHKVWAGEYYQKNKDKIIAKVKKYGEENKLRIQEKNKVKVCCELCNKEMNKTSMNRHIKMFCKYKE